jgi:hypothetical protein
MNWMGRRVVAASVGSLLIATAIMGASPRAAAYVRAGGARVDRPANVQAARSNVNVHHNVNANRNVNVNQNVNVNRNVNVNEHGYYGGGYGGCYNCNGWGHPVAAAVAVTATAVAIGTLASSLPSSGCTSVAVGGVAYQKCGPNYYQPTVQNGATQYVVVNPP